MADHVPALSTPLDRSLLRGGCVHGGNNHGCTHPPHPSAAGRLFPWVQQMDRGERSGDEDRDPLSLLPTHVVTILPVVVLLQESDPDQIWTMPHPWHTWNNFDGR
jgi:hypothetical protein